MLLDSSFSHWAKSFTACSSSRSALHLIICFHLSRNFLNSFLSLHFPSCTGFQARSILCSFSFLFSASDVDNVYEEKGLERNVVITSLFIVDSESIQRVTLPSVGLQKMHLAFCCTTGTTTHQERWCPSAHWCPHTCHSAFDKFQCIPVQQISWRWAAWYPCKCLHH